MKLVAEKEGQLEEEHLSRHARSIEFKQSRADSCDKGKASNTQDERSNERQDGCAQSADFCPLCY